MGLFHHFLCAFLPVQNYCFSPTACGMVLLFLCICVPSSMVAWGLVSRAAFWGTLGMLWLNTNTPLLSRSLVSPLWLFNPFISLMDGLVSMSHKVIQAPSLMYFAVFRCGFIGSSPGNTVYFWEGERNHVPSFLSLHNFSLNLATALHWLSLSGPFFPGWSLCSSVPSCASMYFNNRN